MLIYPSIRLLKYGAPFVCFESVGVFEAPWQCSEARRYFSPESLKLTAKQFNSVLIQLDLLDLSGFCSATSTPETGDYYYGRHPE
jgi:hypothetical protein